MNENLFQSTLASSVFRLQLETFVVSVKQQSILIKYYYFKLDNFKLRRSSFTISFQIQ
jgi:hypothetical protein